MTTSETTTNENNDARYCNDCGDVLDSPLKSVVQCGGCREVERAHSIVRSAIEKLSRLEGEEAALRKLVEQIEHRLTNLHDSITFQQREVASEKEYLAKVQREQREHRANVAATDERNAATTKPEPTLSEKLAANHERHANESTATLVEAKSLHAQIARVSFTGFCECPICVASRNGTARAYGRSLNLNEIVVDVSDYETSHGHAPRGRGAWAFAFDGTPATESAPHWEQGTFSEARGNAKLRAQSLGVAKIRVLS